MNTPSMRFVSKQEERIPLCCLPSENMGPIGQELADTAVWLQGFRAAAPVLLRPDLESLSRELLALAEDVNMAELSVSADSYDEYMGLQPLANQIRDAALRAGELAEHATMDTRRSLRLLTVHLFSLGERLTGADAPEQDDLYRFDGISQPDGGE